MGRSLLEIYALAVCFVTLVCFSIVLGVASYDLIQIAKPEFTISGYEFRKHSSNEEFITTSRCSSDDKEGLRKKPEEEVTKLRLESYKRALQDESRLAMQSFARMAIIILIDIALFYSHWVIARRARLAAATPSNPS